MAGISSYKSCRCGSGRIPLNNRATFRLRRNHRMASSHFAKSPRVSGFSTAVCNSFHSVSSLANESFRRSVTVGSEVASCSKCVCSVLRAVSSCRAVPIVPARRIFPAWKRLAPESSSEIRESLPRPNTMNRSGRE